MQNNTRFCWDCEFLRPKENTQKSDGYKCQKFNASVRDYFFHSKIMKCKECVEYGRKNS